MKEEREEVDSECEVGWVGWVWEVSSGGEKVPRQSKHRFSVSDPFFRSREREFVSVLPGEMGPVHLDGTHLLSPADNDDGG